jgi:hypothetical protein
MASSTSPRCSSSSRLSKRSSKVSSQVRSPDVSAHSVRLRKSHCLATFAVRFVSAGRGGLWCVLTLCYTSRLGNRVRAPCEVINDSVARQNLCSCQAPSKFCSLDTLYHKIQLFQFASLFVIDVNGGIVWT